MRATPVLILCLLISACSRDYEGYYFDSDYPMETYARESAAISSSILDYFPTGDLESWTYGGSGNEFAAYTRKVIQRRGTLVHIQETTSGATVDKVYRISGGTVTLLYSDEATGATNVLEARPNRNQVILQAPLQVGQRWSNADEQREVMDTDARVESPGGIYTGCIEIESRQLGTGSSTTEFYCPGIGLVQRVFQSNGSTVISYLREHSPGM